MRTHTHRPEGHRPHTNPDAPHDAGRNTPAARSYTNDRRSGRTHPGTIEIIGDADPRRLPRRYVPNRRDRRAMGLR